MLRIVVPGREFFDESKEEFITTKTQALQLEHSLVSISKWESKWRKPFLSKENKTREEILDYVRCMTLTQNVDPNVYWCLSNANLEAIHDYIDAPMTATTFGNSNEKGRKKIVTAEVFYYWMTALNIPPEYAKWHLNRLITLIRVCNEENKPPKKMSKRELMQRNSALNAARRKKYHTRG